MRKSVLLFVLCSMAAVMSYAQSTVVKGITVVVGFEGDSTSLDFNKLGEMINEPSGFDEWGNNGSVREYFLELSDGKFDASAEMVHVTLDSSYHYYNESGERRQKLFGEVVDRINEKYPSGFNGLSVHPQDNKLWYFQMVCKKTPGSGGGPVHFWANQDNQSLSIKNNGVDLPVKNVAYIPFSGDPDINPVCHELGHNLFNWNDYYDASGTTGNIGHYCMMGSGGNVGNPMPLNPALRNGQGWIDQVIDITNIENQVFTATANDVSQVYKYTNEDNPEEYLLIEPYIHGGYYIPQIGDGYTTDQGLAIWYVDEDGNPNKPRLRVVQADGTNEMHDPDASHRDHRGDLTDLFDDFYDVFSDDTHPFRWKDGSKTDLEISEISAPGATMSFTVKTVQGEDLTDVYDVPQASAIPNGFQQYSEVHTLGTGGPDLSHVSNSVFNWWGNGSNPQGLYQFSLETTNGSPAYYTNVADHATYQLHQPSPEISIDASVGYAGLEGDYWVTFDQNNLVLVEKSGDYALYFSNSATPPNAKLANEYTAEVSPKENTEKPEITIAPNPSAYEGTLHLPEEMKNVTVNVFDSRGNQVDRFEGRNDVSFGADYKPGLYHVKVSGSNGQEQLTFLKQ